MYSVAYDHHRRRAITSDTAHTMRIWDIITGECLYVLSGHTALVGMLQLSTTRLLQAFSDTTLRLHDADQYSKTISVESHSANITSFTHDDVKTVYVTDGAIKLFDSRTGKYVRTLGRDVTSAWQCFIKDNYLVVAVDRTGPKSYEVFDFGKLDHWSGLDNDNLDDIEGPRWRLALPDNLDRKWYPSFPKLKSKMVDSYRPSTTRSGGKQRQSHARLQKGRGIPAPLLADATDAETEDEEDALHQEPPAPYTRAAHQAHQPYVVNRRVSSGEEDDTDEDNMFSGSAGEEWDQEPVIPGSEMDNDQDGDENMDDDDGDDDMDDDDDHAHGLDAYQSSAQPPGHDADRERDTETPDRTVAMEDEPLPPLVPMDMAYLRSAFDSSGAGPSAAHVQPLGRRSSSKDLQERLRQRAEAAIRNATSSSNSSSNASPSASTRLTLQRGAQQAFSATPHAEPPTSAHAHVAPALGVNGMLFNQPSGSSYVDDTAYMSAYSAEHSSTAMAGPSRSTRETRASRSRRSMGATAGGSPLPRVPSLAGIAGAMAGSSSQVAQSYAGGSGGDLAVLDDEM